MTTMNAVEERLQATAPEFAGLLHDLVTALRDCLALLESDTVISTAEGWEEAGEMVLAIETARAVIAATEIVNNNKINGEN